jgi:hypothetical protein
LSKNTRWALVGVGVLIIAVAALVISSGNKGTKATEQSGATPATTQPSGGAATSSTGSTSSGAATSGGGSNSGGATAGGGGSSPQNNTGGAKPEDNSTGGAKVSTQQGPLLVAGKVAKIVVNKGDMVYVRAQSATDNELHIHGYDYKVKLPAGQTVSYKFKADIDGVFTIEFENQGLQVAELKVNP